MFCQPGKIHVISLEFTEKELKDLIKKLDSTEANAHSNALAHFTKLGGFDKLFYTVSHTSKMSETKEQAS